MARGELIAEGLYQLRDEEGDRGRETWQLSRLGHGGLVVSTRLDQTRPAVESWIVSYELSNKWAPRGLSIRLESDGGWVRTEQRAERGRWTARVESPAGAQEFALEFGPESEVAFPSPLFRTITLVRTAVAIGQSRALDVILIQPGSLAPVAEQQTLTCIGEEKIQVPAGSFVALRYELAATRNGAADRVQAWADNRGVVLQEEGPGGLAARLARYRWLARR